MTLLWLSFASGSVTWARMTCSLLTSLRNVRESTSRENLDGPPSGLTRVLAGGLLHIGSRLDFLSHPPTHNRRGPGPSRGLFQGQGLPRGGGGPRTELFRSSASFVYRRA
ncbi:hypothetical protein E2C01_035527 [Portunus trituberculatus]|uniref:Secreted protein n=1 Tax=Portunus trituberculatus TaxID=210409 RepID=A0A5B7F9E1_PORTR|nr:hypothetical protein [Portunus trituberculatus]